MDVDNQPPSRTPRQLAIRDAARLALEEEGPDGLVIRRLCARIGVHAPNLYRQFPDKTAIEAAISEQAAEELVAALSAGAEAGSAPVVGVADAYRAWSLAHPDVYRLMLGRPAPDASTDGASVIEQVAAALTPAAGGDVARAWTLLAILHGFVMLEIDGRLAPESRVEAVWASTREALEGVVAALA